MTGVPQAIASVAGEAGGVRDHGQDGGTGATDETGHGDRREPRGVDQAATDVLSTGGPGQRGPIVRAGPDQEDPRGPGDVLWQSVRSAGLGQHHRCPQERAQVLARVVAAGVDEVALGQAQALSLTGRIGVQLGRRGPDGVGECGSAGRAGPPAAGRSGCAGRAGRPWPRWGSPR